MKKLIFIFFLLTSFTYSFSQFSPNGVKTRFTNGLGLPIKDTVSSGPGDSAQIIMRPMDSLIYFRYQGYWRQLGKATGNYSTTYALSNDVKDSIQARIRSGDSASIYQTKYRSDSARINLYSAILANITSINNEIARAIGIEATKVNYLDSTIKYVTPSQGDNKYFILQPQSPTSTLSGGYNYERTTGSTISSSVSWGAGRQSGRTNLRSTSPLLSIIVNGVTQTFTQPTPGSSVSGTQAVTVATNANVSISNVVTTTTGETATSTTAFTFYDRRYIGWAATTTPTNAEILAAINKDNSGGYVPYSATLAQLGSALYLFYANTSQATSISVNGFPSTAAFALNVSKSFTNASGGITTYYVTTSNNAIGATSATTLTVN